MLFTILACSIFIFLTLTIGNWLSFLLHNIFKSTRSSIFQNFLSGFVFIGTYLNTWSLFLPVNFYALVPVFILSIFILKYSAGITEKIKIFITQFFRNRLAIISIPVLLVIIVYALLPPQHGDSPGYHFLTIRWNEEYRAIHGLANLHGRLGFNSSFFVSSAAFAFTKIAGQPLYVLNIVFAICYYLWLISKIYFYKSSLWSMVFVFLAIAMFRQLIDVISSPTPDVLSAIIVSYVFITIAESLFLHNGIEERQCAMLILLICFAFTVKLSTFPLSFIALFLFLYMRLYKSRKAMLIISGIGSIILIPWIIRNYILTGYLVFPVSAAGFLHPDWQVPFQILHFEKLLINNGPKMISANWEAVASLSFSQWFPLWIKANFSNGLAFSLVILIAAVASALTSLILAMRKRLPPFFWMAIINLISITFWICNSPDYRFGYPYLISAVLVLLLFLTKNKPVRVPLKLIAAGLAVILCAYYIKHAIAILSPFQIKNYTIKPFRGQQYDQKNDLSNFPSVILNDQVKLYVEDSIHWCNMAPLPCCTPGFYKLSPGQIQLRGNNIEDGFRIIEK